MQAGLTPCGVLRARVFFGPPNSECTAWKRQLQGTRGCVCARIPAFHADEWNKRVFRAAASASRQSQTGARGATKRRPPRRRYAVRGLTQGRRAAVCSSRKEHFRRLAKTSILHCEIQQRRGRHAAAAAWHGQQGPRLTLKNGRGKMPRVPQKMPRRGKGKGRQGLLVRGRGRGSEGLLRRVQVAAGCRAFTRHQVLGCCGPLQCPPPLSAVASRPRDVRRNLSTTNWAAGPRARATQRPGPSCLRARLPRQPPTARQRRPRRFPQVLREGVKPNTNGPRGRGGT